MPPAWRSERAAQTLRDLRVAEVVQQGLVITDGKVEAYRSSSSCGFERTMLTKAVFGRRPEPA